MGARGRDLGLALSLSIRHALAAAGLDGFDAGSEEGPDELTPDGQDPLYADLYHQLLELGFQPAGVTWEKTVGKPKIKSLAFLHPRDCCRALAVCSPGRRLPSLLHYPVHGWRGRADDQLFPPTVARPRLPGPGRADHRPARLLEEHRRDAAPFVLAGHARRVAASLEDIVAAKRDYHANPTVQRHYRRTGRLQLPRQDTDDGSGADGDRGSGRDRGPVWSSRGRLVNGVRRCRVLCPRAASGSPAGAP